VLVDTPPASAGDPAAVEALAKAFAGAAVDEIHLTLRAGTGAGAGAELLDALRPLGPNRLLLTGAAETRHLGGALDLAIRAELPLSYVATSAAELAPADPRALASTVMP
jgi:flagellar biosynthesis GTPase FlhF